MNIENKKYSEDLNEIENIDIDQEQLKGSEFLIQKGSEVLEYFDNADFVEYYLSDDEKKSTEEIMTEIGKLDEQKDSEKIIFFKKQINKISWLQKLDEQIQKKLEIDLDGKSYFGTVSDEKLTKKISKFINTKEHILGKPVLNGDVSSDKAFEVWDKNKNGLIEQIVSEDKLTKILNDIDTMNESLSENMGVRIKEVANILKKEEPATEIEKSTLNLFFKSTIRDQEANKINEDFDERYYSLIRDAFGKVTNKETDLNSREFIEKEDKFYQELEKLYEENPDDPQILSRFKEGLRTVYKYNFIDTPTLDNISNLEFSNPIVEMVLEDFPTFIQKDIFDDHFENYHEVRQSFQKYIEIRSQGLNDQNGANIFRKYLETDAILKANNIMFVPYQIGNLIAYADKMDIPEDLKNKLKDIGENTLPSMSDRVTNYSALEADKKIELAKEEMELAVEIIKMFGKEEKKKEVLV